MKVALVCIAKNEDHYIQEWVDYNLKLGFDHIFIYMNDWRTDIEHPQVTKIEFDGLDRQRDAYANWTVNYRKNYDWAAFFDVDEFLVLKQHKTIQDFILNYNTFPAIAINWYLFGNNGHTEVIDNQYSLIKRFTKRGAQMNHHVKTILNCEHDVKMDVHNPFGLAAVSTNGVFFHGPFNDRTDDTVAQLNHYFCKTKEEFIKKCERGRADTIHQKNTYEINYHPYNLNDVEDLLAYNFMYGE